MSGMIDSYQENGELLNIGDHILNTKDMVNDTADSENEIVFDTKIVFSQIIDEWRKTAKYTDNMWMFIPACESECDNEYIGMIFSGNIEYVFVNMYDENPNEEMFNPFERILEYMMEDSESDNYKLLSDIPKLANYVLDMYKKDRYGYEIVPAYFVL